MPGRDGFATGSVVVAAAAADRDGEDDVSTRGAGQTGRGCMRRSGGLVIYLLLARANNDGPGR